MGTDGVGGLSELKDLRDEFTRFMMPYKFGIDEMMTKINILKEEFAYIHEYNPIEHVGSRLKSPEAIVEKALRRDVPLTFPDIREQILDIAGVRVTCSFISDTDRVCDMLTAQKDISVVEIKDYIRNPKPNGYQSLHVLAEIPVFLSDRVEDVPVEVQIRTIAMDFWASLEHKIYYKYSGDVPDTLLDELKEAADVAARLDQKMERLHGEVAELNGEARASEGTAPLKWAQRLSLSPRIVDAFSRARSRSRGDSR